MNTFPIIDVQATGANILRLRKLNGLSVKDLQVYFGFEGPLPSVDNLFALSKLFNTSIDEILVERHSAEVSFLLFKIFICAIKGISCEKA